MKKLITICLLIITLFIGGMTVEAKTAKKNSTKTKTTQTSSAQSSSQWIGDVPSAKFVYNAIVKCNTEEWSYLFQQLENRGYRVEGYEEGATYVKPGVCKIDYEDNYDSGLQMYIEIYDKAVLKKFYTQFKGLAKNNKDIRKVSLKDGSVSIVYKRRK